MARLIMILYIFCYVPYQARPWTAIALQNFLTFVSSYLSFFQYLAFSVLPFMYTGLLGRLFKYVNNDFIHILLCAVSIQDVDVDTLQNFRSFRPSYSFSISRPFCFTIHLHKFIRQITRRKPVFFSYSIYPVNKKLPNISFSIMFP